MDGYRHVKCPGCLRKLRIKISEKDFGKNVTVICPDLKCGTRMRVNIPVPPPERTSGSRQSRSDQPSLEDLLKIFGNLPKDKY